MNSENIKVELKEKYNVSQVEIISEYQEITAIKDNIIILDGKYYFNIEFVEAIVKSIKPSFSKYTCLKYNFELIDELEYIYQLEQGNITGYVFIYTEYEGMIYSKEEDRLYLSNKAIHNYLYNYSERDNDLNLALNIFNKLSPKEDKVNFKLRNVSEEIEYEELIYNKATSYFDFDKGFLKTSEVAYKLSITTRKLNILLELLGYQTKVAKKWIPKQELIDKEECALVRSTYGAMILWSPNFVDILRKQIKEKGLYLTY